MRLCIVRCEVEGWLTSHLTEVQLWGKKFTKCRNSGENGNILDFERCVFGRLGSEWGGVGVEADEFRIQFVNPKKFL